MSALEHEELVPEGAERRPLSYRNVARVISETPWAIHPSTLATIVDLISYRAHGHRLTQAEVAERIEDGRMSAAARRGPAGAQGAVAVLPIWGVIAPRATAFESVSSPAGTGIDAFTQMFRAALADPQVGSILLEIDSPGGQVGQVPELAAEIRRARGQKPIVAIANGRAASAAYWLAAQADEIVVTPSGEVGSIGVYAAHQDLSGALEQEGVKVTLISAGKFKTEGNPFEPLSEEALAAFQSDVDAFYGMFLADVAKGRGVPVDDVRAGFGEGRMVMAQAAVRAGMADRVATFDDTVARMAAGKVGSRAARAEGHSITISAATVTDAQALAARLIAAGIAGNEIQAADEPSETDDLPVVEQDREPIPAAEQEARVADDRLDLALLGLN